MPQYRSINNPGSEELSALFDEWCASLPPAECNTARALVDRLVRMPIRNMGEKSAKELIVITLTHPAVRHEIRAMRKAAPAAHQNPGSNQHG